MPTVLVAGKIHPSGLALLGSNQGVDVINVEEVSLASYLPHVDRADAVLIRTQPMPAEAIRRAQRLQIVSRHGVGYDAVDVAELDRRRIPLTIVGDVNSRTVAEHAMTLLLAASKRLLRYDACVRNGNWNYRNSLEATEIGGRTLLIVGFGRIGRLVAGMAGAFGVTCIAFDPFQGGEAIRAGGAEPVQTLEEGLARADLVTLHLPKADAVPLIGAREMALMKPGAILVNTARGGLVDEAAMAAALAEGRLGGAATDVFLEEPPGENPLFADDRIVFTPHSAGLTVECAERMAVSAAQNILDFFAGRLDPALIVNRDAIGWR